MRNRLVFSMLMRRPPVRVHLKTVVLLMHAHEHVATSLCWMVDVSVSIRQPVCARRFNRRELSEFFPDSRCHCLIDAVRARKGFEGEMHVSH